MVIFAFQFISQKPTFVCEIFTKNAQIPPAFWFR